MGKLEDLRVERVDGVDRPATGHRWVIVKSEEADPVEKDYAGAARAAIEALSKEEGVTVSKETAEALTALAALLEMSVEFKSVEGAPASDDTDGDPAATVADDEPLTKATLRDALMEVFASEEDDEDADEDEEEGEVEKTEPTSRQPQEQDETGTGTPLTRGRVRKSGRPSFGDIVFGQ